MATRQSILCVLGHVDVGKTALLDKIRGTSVMYREPGTMTQHIGASFLPWSALEKMCQAAQKDVSFQVRIPGFLVIDTPGHEVFVNLRRRGGSIADMAILVVDLLESFEAQTHESIEILRSRKTPFIVAANKLDRVSGWKSSPDGSFLKSLARQDPEIVARFEEFLYRIVADFAKKGIRADRFDRVKDFTRVVAIVPTSAATGEGIPELLLTLAGLTQRYMADKLTVTEGPAKGVVLEVKEEIGLGVTVDAIVYDGILRKDDTIVLGTLEKPLVTHVRALLLPKPLDEMRSPEDRFLNVNEVAAAAGVKVVAPMLENAIPGAPLVSVWDESKIEAAVSAVSEEVSGIRESADIDGVVLKTDALGSLEAIKQFLKNKNVKVRLADVGPISKRDVVEAAVVKEHDYYSGVIIAFNVKTLPDAQAEIESRTIPVFSDPIVYRMFEAYFKWVDEEKTKASSRALAQLVRPAVVKFLPDHVFRRSGPIVIGVEVLKGRIKQGWSLMDGHGEPIGPLLQIQDQGKPVQEALKGDAVAISIKSDLMVGRHVKEGALLYVDVPEEHARIIKTQFADVLSSDESEALAEITDIRRKQNPFWGA